MKTLAGVNAPSSPVVTTPNRSVLRLIVDNVAYWAVNKILDRAHRKGLFSQPMVVPTSDLIGRRLVSTGNFELTQFDAVDQLISSPQSLVGVTPDWRGALVDVGANIGLYTIRYAGFFDLTIAIEPNPSTYFALMANILMGRVQNTESICIGASNTTGKAKLQIAESGNIGWSTLDFVPDRPCYFVDIDIDSLDNIVAKVRKGTRIALLKIDVERHELEVLQGADDILRRDGPVVLFEALSGEAGVSCMKLLKGHNYNQFFTFSRRISLVSLVTGLPIVVTRVDPDSPSSGTLVCAMRT
jgi:FkbM family methyltransferase